MPLLWHAVKEEIREKLRGRFYVETWGKNVLHLTIQGVQRWSRPMCDYNYSQLPRSANSLHCRPIL